MPKNRKGSFDYLNFAYGLGAAIVIVGAMFKFLGWEYANEMFLIGLTTEAVIFLISGVEFKTPDNTLHWERVFPQLDPKYRGEMAKMDLAEIQNVYFKNTEQLAGNINAFSDSLERLNESITRLGLDVQRIGTSIDKIEHASVRYEQELNTLSDKMNKLNAFYNSVQLVRGGNDGVVHM
ncbi:MAG: gliding motility protein GldL [Bacteroidetes bacterium]|jgi:gliding motility-associated protein GldL|nr:gliding motility protein GldL [Bacteroidota bacterium]